MCNWVTGGRYRYALDIRTKTKVNECTAISNVMYDYVYSQNCNQMMMIKSNGGSGSVSNVLFDNFSGHTNAYTLYIDSDWTQEALAPGNGVEYFDISFTHWYVYNRKRALYFFIHC
jgi:hypothetical protein